MKKTITTIIVLAGLVLSILFPIACKEPPPENKPPTANAGTNFEHNITTSGSTVQLNGSGSDQDGTIASYAWTCTSSPSGATPTFVDSAVQNPTVNGLTKLGNYTFALKVTDNDGAESMASVVTVTMFRMATATIEVASNAFVAGPSINFVPNYSGWNPDFPSGSVTYTLVSADPTVDLNSYNGVVPADIYANGSYPIFTQTFYCNGEIVGSRSIVALATSNNFPVAGSNVSSLSPSATIPNIPLSLSKKIVSE